LRERLDSGWERRDAAVVFSVAVVAVVTGAVFALRPIAPVVSLGVLYVLAVVAVAVVYGLAYAIPVSVASMLAFNFLFLPPVHTFALRESENWVALAVYLIVGIVVGELATRSRRLAREAVEAETLRQADAVKTAVLHAVSHDLRSPLTAIRAENLLDLSRLEAGPARRTPELWTADALLASALEQLGREGERVETSFAADVALVRVDGSQLQRVLVNLLENALKFSSPGDPIDATVAGDGRRVLVRIRDRGPGIAEADRERIFDAFERGSTSGPGSGLGLAIARGFTEANGGRVWVEPDDEGTAGATFVLELPAIEEGAAVSR
jgi:K+-sensing histidine kinase KdpD